MKKLVIAFTLVLGLCRDAGLTCVENVDMDSIVKTCEVENCVISEAHTHEVCQVAGCTRTDEHRHESSNNEHGNGHRDGHH